MLQRRQRKESKGMRKHIRRQKALKRKNELKEQKNKQAASQLPDYDKIPRRIRGSYNWQCPHCKASFWNSPSKTIKTQQGQREIFECENCNKYFRP